MSLSNDNTVMTMPVAPVYQGYGNGNSFGWGGDWMSWLLLFVLFGGWGNNGYGWGNGGYGGFNSPNAQGTITRADLNEGFALNGLQNGQTSIKDTMVSGFHGVDNAVCQLGHQLQDCCCQTQSAIQGVRYDIATTAAATQNTIQNTTRDIIDNANANSRAILQALNQNYIRTLENENQSLKLAASQADQNAVLKAAMDANVAELLRRTGHDCPTAAYVVQPPTPVTFPNYCNPCGTCG